MKTVLTFSNHDYPSLNILLRMHWAARKKLQTKLQWLIKSQTKNKHKGKVTIRIHRYSVKATDLDNLFGGIKELLDALRKNNVICEDNPNIVTALIPEFTKVRKLIEQKTFITISDL